MEEKEEGQPIEFVPLNKWTLLATATEEERISSIQTPASVTREPIQVETLEDEKLK